MARTKPVVSKTLSVAAKLKPRTVVVKPIAGKPVARAVVAPKPAVAVDRLKPTIKLTVKPRPKK